MQAFAAETAHAADAAEHGQAFYDDPTFWVLIAFIILIAAVGKMVFRTVATMLDDRAETIRAQIDEATRLREEAQDLLATYERRQQDAAQEAEEIVERAKAEAARLADHAAADLEASLKRREKQAMDRIAQAEQSAVDEVRALAVDVAISATRQLLAEQAGSEKGDRLIDDAIKNLGDKLH